MPKIPLDQVANYRPSDCLTDDEKRAAIEYAKRQVVDRMRFKMKQRGMRPGDIEFRISELTDETLSDMIDQEEVLRSANFRKFIFLQDLADKQAKDAERKKKIEDLAKECDANFFFNLIRRYFLRKHGVFEHDSANTHFVKAVCFFFSNDPRFVSELGYSFGKGLLINGVAGLGKTEVIRAVSGNPINPVMIYSMLEITDFVRANGSLDIDCCQTVLLDDVGTEESIVKHFGTNISWFKEFIEKYYLEQKIFYRLIVTTNCGGDELQDRYGYRVRSRMREMFNVIELTGKDRRK